MSEIDKIIQSISPIYRKRREPSSQHQIVYDSTSETLEPIYFWILDFMNGMFGGKVEKLVDNFASSPGSGHFSEIQGKASHMQQEASRVMVLVNTILKSVINLLYDLKEFQIRLNSYDEANSSNPNIREGGILALKQVWMDKVDMQRGNGSINALSSGNLQFVTLRNAFLQADSIEAVDKLDLNEIVKRVLKPRIAEFNQWRKISEKELRKRFEIEKTYLKSQVAALKLNARWAKPYLKAAQQLESNESLGRNPAMVNIFNTIMLELTLMGKRGLKVEDAAYEGDLPKGFTKIKNLRKYNSIVFVDFNFRGIPSKAGQHYVFGGRAEVTFKSYALTDEELVLLNKKMEDSDVESSLRLIQGMTEDSLQQLKVDLDEFLKEDKKQEEIKSNPEDINPFTALFSIFKKSKTEDKKDKKDSIEEIKKKVEKSENYAEQYIRNLAEANAINSCFTIYDIYKKAHGMAAFPYSDEAEAKVPQTDADKLFGFK